ncbi:hypothetical protein THF5H11_20141 [Vibrio jasicida]|nr:hypothetical protein THF5H11_20141 [Vibrio jasicida]CAH1608424.1 hypothetical protein THF5G08_60144 [Vibrio jasicida]
MCEPFFVRSFSKASLSVLRFEFVDIYPVAKIISPLNREESNANALLANEDKIAIDRMLFLFMFVSLFKYVNSLMFHFIRLT